MNQNQESSFIEMLSGIYEFYGKKLTAPVIGIWLQAMRGYDLHAISDALGRHAMNPDSGQFLPKPADVVRMIDGGTVDSALVAWSKFDRAVRSVGPYMTVVFDDPIIHRVIEDMGGWTAFATKTDDEWPFIKNEFANRHRGYSLRGGVPTYPPKLLGLIDADRAANNLPHDPINTRLIGNPAQAEAVLRGGINAPAIGISKPTGAVLRLVSNG